MFTDISSLPLGKILQPIQQKGVRKQTSAPTTKIRKIRKKGY